MPSSFGTTNLHELLDRLRGGDNSAWDELDRHVGARLKALARRMLGDFPAVKRRDGTDDVLQNVSLRLLRALREVRPASVRAFFRLAGENIRRELLDLKRHYCGPEGPARHEVSPDGPNGDPGRPAPYLGPSAEELLEWTEFHRQIDELPEEEREVVDLHFYQGMSKAEAAKVLGVSTRTVQRLWNDAIKRLRSVRGGEWPTL